jgi:hypothetical protein
MGFGGKLPIPGVPEYRNVLLTKRLILLTG